jgi:hypothetical protein
MRTKSVTIVLLFAVACTGCHHARASSGRTLIAHDFSASNQGWMIATDTGLVEPEFEARGGNPGGYIAGKDEEGGETWYFRAPATVLKELPNAARGVLTYSLKQSATDTGFPDDDVVIVGAAGRLSYRLNRPPDTEWTPYSVPLSAPGWTWNWNRPATEEQFSRVLRAPVRLEIRGEYRTGPDVGGLDSVSLIAPD